MAKCKALMGSAVKGLRANNELVSVMFCVVSISCSDCVFVRHDLAELLIRLKQFDKAEKLLKQFLDQEQKG